MGTSKSSPNPRRARRGRKPYKTSRRGRSISILNASFRQDASIPKASIRQIKAARALLGWSQDDLARNSGVSAPTRLEAADGDIGGRAGTGLSLVTALERAGVEFIPENGGGAGVRLSNRTRQSN